ncbi:NnrS family protein [Pseudophaeobacter leonis]|uniref:NnrS family protein n=1 Tax=Pseudophaeobacter leonis TaxID=1144477 RepID=UPI0009F57ECE|nr:NnrS family protein [Pseudophaeobacter leonis]
MTPRPAYTGPALFSYGFRPFFAGASVFALLVVPLWLLIWQGRLDYQGPFPVVDWHIHEMIFGYGSAVLAGFLFTAVPNWTGRMPLRGWPLATLFMVWLLGRVVLWGGEGVPQGVILVLDSAFLLLVALMIAREVIAGQNWRNLKVLVPVLLLGGANILFHLEIMLGGVSDYGRRLGLALLVFLILLIGGRIIPSFTRNWLAKERGRDVPMPVAFSRFDGVSLGIGAVALLGWVLAPEALLSGLLLFVAAALHGLRLLRWRGLAVLASPLLVMLHFAYLFVALGLLVSGFAAIGVMARIAAVHLLGIGAVGGMTMAVIMRASSGHTARDLVAGPGLTAGFILLLLAALTRVAGNVAPQFGVDWVLLSGVLWTLSFAVLCLRMLPWLLAVNTARRSPNPRAKNTPTQS